MDYTNDQAQKLAEEILRLLKVGCVSAALELLKTANQRFPDDGALYRATIEVAEAVRSMAGEQGIDPDAIAPTRVRSNMVNPIIHPAFELRHDLIVFSFWETRVRNGESAWVRQSRQA